MQNESRPGAVLNRAVFLFDPASVIRPARWEDRRGVLAVNRAGAPGVSPLGEAAFAEAMELCDFFRVVRADGEMVAYLMAMTSDAAYAGEEFAWFRARHDGFLYIDQVAVAEGWRRRGVAALLYEQAEAFARGRGLSRLVCEVNLDPPNPGSAAFHARQGFARAGTLRVGDGRTVSLLVKELEAKG